jgi:hypothetical protein
MIRWEPILSPAERFSEVLFGLIMVLSITGSLSVGGAGQDDVRVMLIGALSCNTAWGLVDAVMYLVTTLVERFRLRSLLDTLRSEPEPRRGQEMIAARIPPLLAESMSPAELELVRQRLLARKDLPEKGLQRRDLLGALAIFLLVFLSTLPVVLPFVFPLEPRVALRVSNGVAILLLFLVGFRVGKYMSYRPVLVALAMVAMGAALVAGTIALGG